MLLTRGEILGLLAGVLAAAAALTPGCRAAPRCENAEAEGCFQACLAGKSAAACRSLATMHSAGVGAGASRPIASMYLERACALGDAASCGRLPAVASAAASAPPQAASCVPPSPPRRALEGLAAQLSTQCEAGKGAACLDLASLADEGAGTQEDPGFAAAQRIRACQLHVPRGCRLAGEALLRGRGVPVQVAEADKMFVAGCMASDVPSCAALGEINLRRPEVGLAQRGYGQIQAACQGADPVSCRRQAQLLREGVVVAKSEESADRLIDRSIALVDAACSQGDREACARLGVWREYPSAIDEPAGDARTADQGSLDAATTAYTRACEGGLTAGCARLADGLRARGRDDRASEVERQLAAACQAGDVTSCSGLLKAPFLIDGRPTEHRATLARACEMAVGAACVALAAIDEPQAATLLERACNLGDRAGCERLVQRASDPQAARRRACEQGAGESCARLALDHQQGNPSPDKACLQALIERSCRSGEATSTRACGWAAEVARALGTPEATALLPTLEDEGCRLATAARSPDPEGARGCLGRGSRAGVPPDEAQKAIEESCRLGSGAGCLALGRLLAQKGAAVPARERFAESCRRGERAGCEQAFGPLPAASSLVRGAR
jgi:TPR repeat protein